MPAKPKRGTVPSLDGGGVDKRNTFVKRKFHFRPIRPLFRPRVKLANPHGRYVCEFPPISALRPLRLQMDTPIYYKKILNKKIPRVYTCERRCAMGGWAEMGGIRKSAQLLHLRVSLMGGKAGGSGGNGRKRRTRYFDAFRPDDSRPNFRLHAYTRKAIFMRARR